MKHEPITANAPARENFATWDDWMAARSRLVIAEFHARERAERRARWAKEGLFS
jgi:hypothetical protein